MDTGRLFSIFLGRNNDINGCAVLEHGLIVDATAVIVGAVKGTSRRQVRITVDRSPRRPTCCPARGPADVMASGCSRFANAKRNSRATLTYRLDPGIGQQ